MDLDGGLIIEEVRKQRSLYDVDDPSYRNREVKREGWIAVTKAVVGCRRFDAMTENEKNVIGKEIQRRWKNIKDTYVKSLKPDARAYGHLKRPYIFHKKLSFLQPHLESKLKKADVSPEHENSGFNSNSSQVQTTALSQKSISSSLMSKFKNLPSKKSKNVKTINGANSFEKKLWDIFKTDLESKRSGLPDPDEQFVRSQIPLLKKLRPSDKLDFQIKWLELVKSYAICEDSNSE